MRGSGHVGGSLSRSCPFDTPRGAIHRHYRVYAYVYLMLIVGVVEGWNK